MTKEELAEILDERPIGHEVTKEEEKLAAENQLVVIYGASDDLCEMCGAIDDEFDCFDGGDIDCKELPGTLTAIWGADNISWTYETSLPHAKFRVYDDDGVLYCVGIVIDLKTKIELKPCPFCGSTNLRRYGIKVGGGVQGYIECRSCGCENHSFLCETNEEARKAAAEKWNRRAGETK